MIYEILPSILEALVHIEEWAITLLFSWEF